MRLDILSCCELSDKEIQHITDRRHQRILINVFLEGKAMGAQKTGSEESLASCQRQESFRVLFDSFGDFLRR